MRKRLGNLNYEDLTGIVGCLSLHTKLIFNVSKHMLQWRVTAEYTRFKGPEHAAKKILLFLILQLHLLLPVSINLVVSGRP